MDRKERDDGHDASKDDDDDGHHDGDNYHHRTLCTTIMMMISLIITSLALPVMMTIRLMLSSSRDSVAKPS